MGILANSLEKVIRDPEKRAAISRGDLCLVTPYSPSAPFSVGTAMGRNKLIYTLADYAIVVASDVEKGALSFPHPFREHPRKLKDWLDAQTAQVKSEPYQPGLF